MPDNLPHRALTAAIAKAIANGAPQYVNASEPASWIIVNSADATLCWSNEEGWVEDTYDTFSGLERKTVSLPIGGEWEQAPWSTK
jgi:hypothetical protein